MWPQLFELSFFGLHIALPTYGALAAVGFSVALWLIARSARRQGLPERELVDIGFWLLVAGLIGARAFYVAQNAGAYVEECFGPSGRGAWRVFVECSRALQVWEGGLVFYGGLVAAVPVSLWLARRQGIAFLRLADLVAPALAVAHFFGRLGCFSAGCCWGKVCHLPFGARFPAASLPFSELAAHRHVSWAATLTPPLHPTQLYEAAGELAIFAWLVRLGARKRFSGQVLLTYVAAYAALRFVVEIFRGDFGRGYVFRLAVPALNRLLGMDENALTFLSTSQLISVIAVVAVALFWRRVRGWSGGVQAPSTQPDPDLPAPAETPPP